MDWKERIVELSKDYGLTDHEVSMLILNEYGINVSDESVRYYARRKENKVKNRSKEKEEGISRTLVLNDLHIPFHREDLIIDIILKHRDKIDTIIFGGDLLDCEAISKYPKVNRKPLVDEMAITYKFLKRVDKLTPNIKKILIWGNHEYRFVRYLAEKGSQLSSLHSDNILEEIVGGFNHYDRETKTKRIYPALSDNFVVINKWYYQHNDLLIVHPKNFSSVELRIYINTIKYFIRKGLKFNALLVAHTHKWGLATDFGIWGGETGCLCNAMEYADNGNINYTPQGYGYALITQVNGVTDINESRIYKLDLEDNLDEWEEMEVD